MYSSYKSSIRQSVFISPRCISNHWPFTSYTTFLSPSHFFPPTISPMNQDWAAAQVTIKILPSNLSGWKQPVLFHPYSHSSSTLLNSYIFDCRIRWEGFYSFLTGYSVYRREAEDPSKYAHFYKQNFEGFVRNGCLDFFGVNDRDWIVVISMVWFHWWYSTCTRRVQFVLFFWWQIMITCSLYEGVFNDGRCWFSGLIWSWIRNRFPLAPHEIWMVVLYI